MCISGASALYSGWLMVYPLGGWISTALLADPRDMLHSMSSMRHQRKMEDAKACQREIPRRHGNLVAKPCRILGKRSRSDTERNSVGQKSSFCS